MALSKSGRYLATGQVTYMGFTADIIIWDLENRQLLHRMGLHKVGVQQQKSFEMVMYRKLTSLFSAPVQVKIQALDFSCDEQYLASLGGPDDNSLVSNSLQT
jgi:hypothetical protein